MKAFPISVQMIVFVEDNFIAEGVESSYRILRHQHHHLEGNELASSLLCSIYTPTPREMAGAPCACVSSSSVLPSTASVTGAEKLLQ